jgi:hypothetical protein
MNNIFFSLVFCYYTLEDELLNPVVSFIDFNALQASLVAFLCLFLKFDFIN